MASSKRISDLPLKSNLAETDLLVIVDTDAGPLNFVSKKTTVLTVKNLAQVVADAQIALQKNQPNGLATIDAATGKIPVALLPSYVDDVEEYASIADFPAVGEAGKIYVTIDTRKVYRWGGSVYVEISPAPGSTDAVPEGAINLYFTSQRAADAAPVQSVNGQTGAVILAIPVESVNGYTGEVVLVKADVGLGNVDNTADVDKPVSNAVQAALDLKEEAGTASAAVAAHEAAVDPHPQYTTTDEASAAAPVQSVNGYVGSVAITKGDVGLSNVDNTSDLNKPISAAVQVALDLKEEAGAATSAIAAHEAEVDPHPQYTTAEEAAAASPVQSVNGYTGEVLLVKDDVGLGDVDNTSDLDKPISAAVQSALDLKEDAGTVSAAISQHETLVDPHPQYTTVTEAGLAAPVQSVNGYTGSVTIVKADLGLNNVDNTSDLNKPISTAVQAALDLKEDAGAATSALTAHEAEADPHPQYVTVAEANLAAPVQSVNGQTGNVTINIPETTDDIAEGNSLYFTDARAALAAPVQSVNGYTGVVNLLKSDVGLGDVDNTSDLNKPISAAVQAALDLKEEVGTAAAAITAHENLADPHPQYTTTEEAGLAAPVQSVNGQTGAVAIDKTSIGLGSVDNTADIDKPVSTAVQIILDSKENAGAASIAVTLHEEAADPHPQYTTAAEAAAAAPVQSVNGQVGAVVVEIPETENLSLDGGLYA